MIKFCFYFALSFFILSFPMGEKKLFYYIDTVTSPMLAPTYQKLASVSKEKFYDIKIWALDLIDNSKQASRLDKVTTTLAAPLRSIGVRTKDQNKEKDKDQKIADSLKGLSDDALERKSEIEQIEYYSDEEVKQLEAMLRNADQ